MTNIQHTNNTHSVANTTASLRAAYGPGFQLSGPTDATLRAATGQSLRHHS